MNKIFYIAYGSNLNLEQMAGRCPDARVIGDSLIKNYRLLFRGGHDSAVATIEPAQGQEVPVLIWELTPADVAALDHYEGWPFLYRKEEFTLRLNDEQVTAMAYIMNEGRELGSPNCYYYSIILDGYKIAGFDVDILRKAVSDSAESKRTDNADNIRYITG